MKTLKPTRTVRMTRAVCNAQQKKAAVPALGLAAAAVIATGALAGPVGPAHADIAGLTKCSSNKAFAKREKKEIKDLERRQKLYEEGSAPFLALEATKERTKARFAQYGKEGLLCGADGLPHLIADPGLAIRFGHAGEIFLPTFGFLYVAGYIGYVGRQYLNSTGGSVQQEIIIDVPKALGMMFAGFGWPLQVWDELKNDTLTEKEENITVSPR